MKGDYTLIHGDARSTLRKQNSASVQCVVTSPPYFGLRDYGVAGQIGLESTPDAYVAQLVDVFREVRRVLKDDGTVWLNLGDSYYGAGQRGGQFGTKAPQPKWSAKGNAERGHRRGTPSPVHGLKFKDQMGIPWRVAFALQQPDFVCSACGQQEHSMLWEQCPLQLCDYEDGVVICPTCAFMGPPGLVIPGWYLRSDIIWHKPNPMPESVTDRPTKAHEYLFLLAKSERYYYDEEAIKEPAHYPKGPGNKRQKYTTAYEAGDKRMRTKAGLLKIGPRDTRNKRTVWTIPTQPYRSAHFATMPEKLVEPCVLAGTAPGDVVLDPFCGSGTVGAVSVHYGRNFIGIDLNDDYLALAMSRIETGVRRVA